MRHSLVVAGLVAVVAAAVLAVSGAGGAAGSVQARWVISDLGTLGGKQSAAAAINERGQIVGTSDTRAKYKNGNPIEHAFLWQNGKMTDLGSFGASSSAADINERGQIVGDAVRASASHAFLWQKGKMLDLTPTAKLSPLNCYDLPGSCDAHGDAINERGQVVVSMDAEGNDVVTPLGFLWQSGKLINLHALGGEKTWVGPINDRGQVVGAAETTITGEDHDPLMHAFLWQNGKMRDLGTLSGQSESDASSINERGQIAGWSTSEIEEGIDARCFLWQDGKMTDLGSLGETA